MNFSTDELVDMVFILGASDRNCLLATRLYRETYPDRRQPRKEALEKLMDRFSRTGKVEYEKTERTKSVYTEENELTVLLKVTENPHISQRIISNETDIKRWTVQNILSKNKMHPYHIQLMQELNDQDYGNRVTFCEWAQQKIQQDRYFFNYVLFVDEATFHKNGNVNRHNFHYYATANQFFIRTHSQTRWSLNAWGGIVGNYVIGPYFFETRVTGPVYLDFLQNELPRLLYNLPNFVKERMWYLHDGAPVHHTALIHEHLNNEFPDRWIGRGGPFQWPPRSPDLTKMDFFLWGYVKDEVYKVPPTTKENMKDRITQVFRNINNNVLNEVSRSFQERLETCLDVNGGHIEHLL